MQLKARYNSIGIGSTRVIALFFLLFTAADILLPQYFCAEEWQSLPVAVSQVATIPPVGPGVPPDAPLPPESAPHEEDCFCCCAHVLPPTTLTLVNLHNAPLPSPIITLPETTLPTAPLQAIYRPPRSA